MITDRILAGGLEPGFNSGCEVDSRQRYIYIHGIGDESAWANPPCRGCIHLGALICSLCSIPFQKACCVITETDFCPSRPQAILPFPMSLAEDMTTLALAAKNAARLMPRLSTDEKNRQSQRDGRCLEAQSPAIQNANAKDLETALEMDLSQAMIDRLLLDEQRVGMAQGLREVAELPDPVGRVLVETDRPSGLKLKKVACPIGVVVMTMNRVPTSPLMPPDLLQIPQCDYFAGGKEALHQTKSLPDQWLRRGNQRANTFLRSDPSRSYYRPRCYSRTAALTELVDLCIPRGGGLIRAVAEYSRVPVIKHYKGICSVYIDYAADADKAVAITVNSKPTAIEFGNA